MQVRAQRAAGGGEERDPGLARHGGEEGAGQRAAVLPGTRLLLAEEAIPQVTQGLLCKYLVAPLFLQLLVVPTKHVAMLPPCPGMSRRWTSAAPASAGLTGQSGSKLSISVPMVSPPLAVCVIIPPTPVKTASRPADRQTGNRTPLK